MDLKQLLIILFPNSTRKFSSHWFVHFLLSSLGDTSCLIFLSFLSFFFIFFLFFNFFKLFLALSAQCSFQEFHIKIRADSFGISRVNLEDSTDRDATRASVHFRIILNSISSTVLLKGQQKLKVIDWRKSVWDQWRRKRHCLVYSRLTDSEFADVLV